MRDNVISVSRVTEEQPLRELQLPRDSVTRLCFFSVPIELLAFYRERVFPSVVEAGFVPVTADDVISPGDNISAKIDALIDRAAVVVCDVGSPGTRAEFEIALSRFRFMEDKLKSPFGDGRREFFLIVIKTEQGDISSDYAAVPLIIRPNIYLNDPEPFIAQLVGWLNQMAPGLTDQRLSEPERLLSAGEYRAAVIAAVSLLEARLRDQLKGQSINSKKIRLGQMIHMDGMSSAINAANVKRVESWIMLRNAAAHSTREISKAQASEVVQGINAILRSL